MLQPDDVKWRTSASKRPWLAGVIKEKMCALIDVDNLIYLLEKGLDSREL
jgi:purine-binding chemotaxis protein CheW